MSNEDAMASPFSESLTKVSQSGDGRSAHAASCSWASDWITSTSDRCFRDVWTIVGSPDWEMTFRSLKNRFFCSCGFSVSTSMATHKSLASRRYPNVDQHRRSDKKNESDEMSLVQWHVAQSRRNTMALVFDSGVTYLFDLRGFCDLASRTAVTEWRRS